MKKLAIILGLLLLGSTAVFADEVATEQVQEVTDTKAAITIQKQPSQDANQKQVVQNIRWAIVIQCQGKPVDLPDSDNR